MTTVWRYDETTAGDPSPFPPAPHRAAGVDCAGSILAEQEGDLVTLRCDVCGALVGKINPGVLKRLEQAPADSFGDPDFSELDVPKVLTSISEECQDGDCEQRPGHFTDMKRGDLLRSRISGGKRTRRDFNKLRQCFSYPENELACRYR
jgi:hypothetical protein